MALRTNKNRFKPTIDEVQQMYDSGVRSRQAHERVMPSKTQQDYIETTLDRNRFVYNKEPQVQTMGYCMEKSL